MQKNFCRNAYNLNYFDYLCIEIRRVAAPKGKIDALVSRIATATAI